MQLKNTKLIVIHCADTPPEMDIGVEEIRKWHLERGWSDIGYHYVIRRDGTLETGRSITRRGAHVRGHNEDSIGICLVGGKGGWSNDKFSVNYTEEQRHTLSSILTNLTGRIAKASGTSYVDTFARIRIAGHNEFSNKDCPCFYVPSWVAHNLKSEVESSPDRRVLLDKISLYKRAIRLSLTNIDEALSELYDLEK